MNATDVPVIDGWTGREAHALRAALRLSVRDFAEQLGVSHRIVSKWEKHGSDITPRPYAQYELDKLLAIAHDDVCVRFQRSVALPERRVAHTRDGAAIVVEPDGQHVSMTIYPRGLDQYAGDTVTLTWRETGVLAVHLLNTADRG